MNSPWRLFKNWDQLVSTVDGLAVDDCLAHSVSDQGSPPILHLYRFKRSAIVGKYQDIEAALKLDRCRELGVEYNRRSTGGGTVIMGERVVALGFGISMNHPRMNRGINAIFRIMSEILIRALKNLGVEAVFRPKNDLEVEGKKIAGLSASSEVGSGILFHCSMLVDFDIPLMLNIMNVPAEKNYEKGYNCFSQRLTTIERELGRPVSMDQVMESIWRSYEEEFQVEFAPDDLSLWEKEKIKELKISRYTDPGWIFSQRHPRSRMGESLKKTRGGLLQVYLSLSGSIIEQVIITGDFFSSSSDINHLESVLKWTPAVREHILNNLASVWKEDLIYGVGMEELADTIMQARNNGFGIT
jgi:lipoate---protein ligase